MAKKPFVEHVEMHGHIVDSLLLPKVLDAVLSRGGTYQIEQFQLGLGSALSVLLFLTVLLLAFIIVKLFRVDLARARGEG